MLADTQENEDVVENQEEQDTEASELIDGITEYLSGVNDTEEDSGEEEVPADDDNSEDPEPDDDSGTGADDDSGGDDEEEPEELSAKNFDVGLIYQASKVGLTQEEVDQCGGNDDLLRRINGKALELLQGKDGEGAEENGEEAEAKNFDFTPVELDLSDYDEGLAKQLGGLVDVVNKLGEAFSGSGKTVAELKQAFDGISQGAQSQQQAQVVDTFDKSLDSIEGMDDLFGKGIPEKGSKQFQNRAKVFDEFDALVAVDRQRGRNTPIEDLAKKAARNVFEKEFDAAKEKEVKNRTVKRLNKRKAMKQPTPQSGTHTAQVDPDKAAIEAVREVLSTIED